MPAFLTADRRRPRTLKLQMIIAARAATSSSIIANTTAVHLPTHALQHDRPDAFPISDVFPDLRADRPTERPLKSTG